MKIYIAGKVSKDSAFGGQHWREAFCEQLAELSGLKLEHLDPVTTESGMTQPLEIFAKDCRLINQADVFVIYLSDDISVGGSQEILIARYLHKPVIGLAPRGGKFNGRTYEMPTHTIKNYKDPFVFTTCDVVCETVEQIAEALKDSGAIQSTGLDIIDNAISN